MVVPLIIDTDPGVDDVLAILLALGRADKVKIEAITLNFGNTTLDHCKDNILRMFHVLHKHVDENPTEVNRNKLAQQIGEGASPIILSEGAAEPLGGRQFTAAYFHGRDGLSGASQLEGNPFPVPKKVPSPLQISSKPAHEVILDILKSNPPGTVRIAAVGPLTNIALAWEKDPETFLRVGGISVMGCTLDVPGNTTPTAEFNTFADPFAAVKLLHDAPLHPMVQKLGGRLPIDVLPLDITSVHLVPFSRLCDDSNTDPGILCRFRRAILANPRKVTNSLAHPLEAFDPHKDDLFMAHDPLAVAHAIFCPSTFQRSAQQHTSSTDEVFEGWHVKTRRFGIETEGALTRGMCVVDRRRLGRGKKGMNKVDDEKSRHEKPTADIRSDAERKVDETSVSDQKPTDGEWDVVIATPGSDWFSREFCSALGV
ncbi:hypothetical protein CBS101457_003945 [Exobasidium rhododendri]|nr:hypothetical protein CBS101457_003945 [Exobasidium rhododendri]